MQSMPAGVSKIVPFDDGSILYWTRHKLPLITNLICLLTTIYSYENIYYIDANHMNAHLT